MRKYPRLSVLPAVLTILLAWVWACDEVPEELTEPIPNVPVPDKLAILVGADTLTLSWEYDALFDYAGFAVYRSEDDGASWRKIATVASPPYVDTDLRTGVVYWYRVAGISAGGIEGNRSEIILARATVYTATINGGDTYTNSRDVQILFTAPVATNNVRYSEDQTFTDVQWQGYVHQTLYPYTLSTGDGVKTVYAQFRDEGGNQTETFSGSIILDTFAEISALDFTPKSPPIPPGGTVHFQIETTGNELDGFVHVFVEGMGQSPITVLDDGVGGDPTGADGIYEIDYTFPQFFRGTNMRMSAIFFDAAGNESAEREFADNLSMTDPPDSVFLYPAEDSTTTSITLRWSESQEQHFASYDIYRDDNPGVNSSTSVLAGRVTQQATTIFLDSDLDEAVTYYYVVFVVNDLGEETGSNVRALQTADLPPTPVTLDPPSSVGPTQLTLTWSVNNDTDFDYYEIWQSTSPGVTNGAPSVLAATITDRTEVFADITGLDTVSNDYYFRVYVYDKQGNFSRSNEVTTAAGL